MEDETAVRTGARYFAISLFSKPPDGENTLIKWNEPLDIVSALRLQYPKNLPFISRTLVLRGDELFGSGSEKF